MAINEQMGTSNVLTTARYHIGALARKKETAVLVPAVKEGMRKLKALNERAVEAEEASTEAFGALICSDFEVDDGCRDLELDVLKRVKKNRKDPLYKSVLPKGSLGVTSLRGAEEEREIKRALEQLQKLAPDLYEQYKGLPGLAAEATAAEAAWLQARTRAAQVFTEEVLARSELIRQLQKNEGALQMLFPGRKARVRSFFPATKKGKKKPEE